MSQRARGRCLAILAIAALALRSAPAAPFERSLDEVERLQRSAAAWVGLDFSDACVERLRQSRWQHVELARVAFRHCGGPGSQIVAVSDSGFRRTISDGSSAPQAILDAIGDLSRCESFVIRTVRDAEDYMTIALELVFDHPGLAVVDVTESDGFVWRGTATIRRWFEPDRILTLETTTDGRLRWLGLETRATE